MRFDDIEHPELGGTLTLLLDGSEEPYLNKPDNMTIDGDGQPADPGGSGQQRLARPHRRLPHRGRCARRARPVRPGAVRLEGLKLRTATPCSAPISSRSTRSPRGSSTHTLSSARAGSSSTRRCTCVSPDPELVQGGQLLALHVDKWKDVYDIAPKGTRGASTEAPSGPRERREAGLPAGPALREPAVGDPEDHDRRQLDRLTGGRPAEQRAGVGAAERPADRDPIPLGDQVVDREAQVGVRACASWRPRTRRLRRRPAGRAADRDRGSPGPSTSRMAAGSPAGITSSNTRRIRALLASSVIVGHRAAPTRPARTGLRGRVRTRRSRAARRRSATRPSP